MELADGSTIHRKYWFSRYYLFSRFDHGIKLDAGRFESSNAFSLSLSYRVIEAFYSVTPEVIAAHIAERCRCEVIIDAFTGGSSFRSVNINAGV